MFVEDSGTVCSCEAEYIEKNGTADLSLARNRRIFSLIVYLGACRHLEQLCVGIAGRYLGDREGLLSEKGLERMESRLIPSCSECQYSLM
jgi:hypothetical protein